jgi:branched-chain amino acid transport system permease protein
MSVPRALRRGRPELYSDYAADMALLNTPAKRWWSGAIVLAAAALPFLLGRDLIGLATLVVVYALSGIGLNLISGYAGQLSLGHAFFMGLGAYTAAAPVARPSAGTASTCCCGCRWRASSPPCSAGSSPPSPPGSRACTSRS